MTVEDQIKMLIGQYVVQNIMLASKIEELQKQLSTLQQQKKDETKPDLVKSDG